MSINPLLTNAPRWSVLVCAPVVALLGQTVTPRPGDPPPAASDTVQLSPFVVNSSKDTGYQAMSTMAGTRLDTPLKDVGASISIYTKDFLEDIGAASTNDFLIFATGMDTGGPNGNYSGAIGNDLNAEVPTAGAFRVNPQGTARSRGLSAPTFTRDFFNSSIDIDSYNTERVTIVRGPNSALIGVGSPAGVVDTTLIRANLSRNEHKVSARIDDEGGLRSVVDFNRVLIPDKLAARIAGLRHREEYQQRPAYAHKERIYGTAIYRPFRSTVLRGSFESGNGHSNPPIQTLPSNSIMNEWFALGRPTWDWTFYDDPARNPNAAAQDSNLFIPYHIKLTGLGGPDVYYYNTPDQQLASRILQVRVVNTTGNQANSIKTNLFHPLINRDVAPDNSRPQETVNISEVLPALYWIGGNVLPGQTPGFVPPGIKQQGFNDFAAFDFQNEQIDQTARTTESIRTFNIALEQRAWRDRLGIEVAYDYQRSDRRNVTNFFHGSTANHHHVRIDVNTHLPDGLPNPNLGRPFAQSRGNNWGSDFTENKSIRFTGYAKYDFKDLKSSWASWFGRHTLSGVAERYRSDRISLATSLADDGPEVRKANLAVTARIGTQVVYLGPSLVGNNNPLRISAIKLPTGYTGPQGNIDSFVRAENATDPGSFQPSPISKVALLNNGNFQREVIESKAIVLQSYWLKEHIVTMWGWRKDSDYFANRNVSHNVIATDQAVPSETQWGFNDFNLPNTPRLLASEKTQSYSVVAKWPHKLLRLPAGIDISPFFNYSENFTPSGARRNVWGDSLPPPQGETKEIGLTLSAFNEKLILRAARFETANTGLSVGDQGVTTVPQAFIVKRWEEENLNPHLRQRAHDEVALLLGVLPSNFLELEGLSFTGTPGNISSITGGGVPGKTDTQDFKATGVEFEVVYNPTRNWRILANVAKQKTEKTNILPFANAFHKLMLPIYERIAESPAHNYWPTGWNEPPGTPLPPGYGLAGQRNVKEYVERFSTIPLLAANAAAGFPSAEQREWRVNVVTNYTFSSSTPFVGELLKGWMIGGAVRWQSEFVLGFPSYRDSNNIAFFDLGRPYYGPSELNVDAWLGYERRIWNDKITWKVQLNVSNLLRDRELIPIQAQPWGQVATYRLAGPQRWYLTNTFSF
jgi:outer membrane receptor protein involved in Fe transport